MKKYLLFFVLLLNILNASAALSLTFNYSSISGFSPCTYGGVTYGAGCSYDQTDFWCYTKSGTSASPGHNFSGALKFVEGGTYGSAYVLLRYIRSYSFYKNTGITSLKFCNPSSDFVYNRNNKCHNLTIQGYAFEGCYNIKGSLTLYGYIVSIGNSAFKDCSGFTGTLTLPEGLETLGAHAFEGCSGFDKLAIDASLTTISDSTFCNCSGLTSLSLPSTLTNIGAGAFQGCSSLSDTLVIPNNVTNIGDFAFEGCSDLTGSLTLPKSVTNVGESAFENCSFDGMISIPEDIKSIGKKAFYGNTDIKYVYYPSIDPVGARKDIFSNEVYQNATLVVDPMAAEEMSEGYPWMLFNNMITTDEYQLIAGIDSVMADIDANAPVEIYNLNGVRVSDNVDNLSAGLYIVRQGSKVKKAVIRK